MRQLHINVSVCVCIIFRAALERSALLSVRWELWEISVLLVALSVAQFVRVSCISFMFRASSSAGLSLGLLATDVYTIAAGVFFFRYKVSSVNAMNACRIHFIQLRNQFFSPGPENVMN